MKLSFSLLAVGLFGLENGRHVNATDAPDLIEVRNVRPGNTAGTTYVDFVLDEEARFSNCCQRYQMVPADGSEPIIASDNLDPQGTDPVKTLVFESIFTVEEMARGTIGLDMLESVSTQLLNVPQAASVTGGADGTVNPDLVSVTRDADQVIFEFDEPINKKSDPVESSQALKIFDNSANIYDSLAVKVLGTYTIGAIYSLPKGVSVSDAAGGFVPPENIVGDPQAQPSDENELDVAQPAGDTGAVVCPPSDMVGGTGDGAGPTEAPDLMSIGNFRRGPFTVEYEPTTCVDFIFDQPTFINGGKRSNFQLVPLNAGDPLEGSTSYIPTPEQDPVGDNIITVMFPGELTAADFARGFIDNGVVNSDQKSVDSTNPVNAAQARPLSPETDTSGPDLVSVQREGDTFLFTFDQALDPEQVTLDSGSFSIYFPEAESKQYIPFATSSGAAIVDDFTRRAFFNRLPGNYKARDAVGAYVKKEAVQAIETAGTGNQGRNAFDHVFDIEVIKEAFCEPSTAAGGSGDATGPTNAPDLQSVGNFRQGPYTIEFEYTTCVDFTFDQLAYINGGSREDFKLIPTTGGDPLSGSKSTLPSAEQDLPDDNIITIIYLGNWAEEDFARGFIDTGVVNDNPNRVNSDFPFNIRQSEDIDPEPATGNADLVSAVYKEPSLRQPPFIEYTFDQAIEGQVNNGAFCVYFPDPGTRKIIPSVCSDNAVLLDEFTVKATFDPSRFPSPYTLSDATGAIVQDGAVLAVAGSGFNDDRNAFDEVLLD